MGLTLNDSRSLTDYRSTCSIMSAEQHANNVKDNSSYRFFLEQNADKIMKFNLEATMGRVDDSNEHRPIIQ